MNSQRKKQIIRALLVVFVLSNVLLLLTGKTYVYKALLYNFANIDDNKIFDQALIKKSNKPQPWPVSKQYNHTQLSTVLKNYHSTEKSVAFLVIKNDSILHEEYWDGYSDHSLSNSFSMGKTITSILVGAAIKEGKIKSVDQPIGDFL